MIIASLNVYGVDVHQLASPEIGGRPSLADLESVLREKGPFKLVTITHVDTSTGVISDVENMTKLVKSLHPETLVAVDGVCSLAAEELNMDAWGVDIVMTASQKALGVPPGLCIIVASQQAMVTISELTTRLSFALAKALSIITMPAGVTGCQVKFYH